jgi:hypothetical protein
MLKLAGNIVGFGGATHKKKKRLVAAVVALFVTWLVVQGLSPELAAKLGDVLLLLAE